MFFRFILAANYLIVLKSYVIHFIQRLVFLSCIVKTHEEGKYSGRLYVDKQELVNNNYQLY